MRMRARAVLPNIGYKEKHRVCVCKRPNHLSAEKIQCTHNQTQLGQ